MLAAGSSLIGLLVFLAIAIISSMLKRRQEDPGELPPEPRPRRGSPPAGHPPARNWEDELRHLLEERPVPPPLMREAPPAQSYLPPPIPEMESPGDSGHIEVNLLVPQPHLVPQFQSLPGLAPAQGRYASATQLQERVTRHMADVTHHRVGTTSVQHLLVTPEVRDVVGALRNPRTLRTAMMAAVILGPPRALES